jgi:predicted nucleotidyltransferase
MEINNINDIKKAALPTLRKYGINRAEVTGSYARGNFTRTSDIDIIVDVPSNMSLLTFAGLKVELEEKLGKKVDLLERSAIKQHLRKYILKDTKPII